MVRKIIKRGHDHVFSKIHSKNLIYNSCWEDPRLDRELMQIKPESRIAMITSAGCNALDYLLDNPAEIHCIDLNPRQNALLELKLAMIRKCDYDDIFAFFGRGHHPQAKAVYESIRLLISPAAQDFWDRKIYYFCKPRIRNSFYYHGASGRIAWMVRVYFRSRPKLRRKAMALIEATDIDSQRRVYEEMEPLLWRQFIPRLVRHPATLAMLGVPRAQIDLIRGHYPDGVAGYVRDKLRHIFTEVPINDNYFWRVYLTGSYTHNCCPNYLREEKLLQLREAADRIQLHSTSFTAFLKSDTGKFSHFILLDHQDWLAEHDPQALQEEWLEILRHCQEQTKILIRSAGEKLDFISPEIKAKLRFHPELTETLHRRDRVGTYASFHLATPESEQD